MKEGWIPNPLEAHKTAGGEWWVMEYRDPGDHEFRDDWEPVFEASGTGFEFEEYAHLFAASGDLLGAARRLIYAFKNEHGREPVAVEDTFIGPIEDLMAAVAKAEDKA